MHKPISEDVQQEYLPHSLWFTLMRVSSPLMALKDKGEGKVRVMSHDTCGAKNITQQLKIIFMLLEEKHLLSGEE